MSNLRLHQTGLVEVNVIHIFTILRFNSLDTTKKDNLTLFITKFSSETHTHRYFEKCAGRSFPMNGN